MPERQPPPRTQRGAREQQRDQRYQQNPEPKPADSKLARVPGTWMQAHQANERLAYAEQNCNLISPATSIGALPEGCGLALSLVHVDVDKETYDVGFGKRALSKSALNRLGAALGISWHPHECVRIDDGSDPHYCHFSVGGHYRAFDGQVQGIGDNKEMDLRDGSAQCEEIILAAEKYNNDPRNRNKPRRDPATQIRQLRIHIMSHAETKAKLRATRDIGVHSGYSADELQKPFVCARIMWTGKSDNPELSRMFAEKTADAFLAGTHTLYGGGQPSARTIGAGATSHAPPPVGATPLDPDDYRGADGEYEGEDDYDGSIDTQGESVPTGNAANGSAANGGDFVIPGGRAQGTPLHKASVGDLQYWCDRIGRELDENRSRNPERDGALHQALCDEIALREKPAGGGGGGGAPAQQELKT